MFYRRGAYCSSLISLYWRRSITEKSFSSQGIWISPYLNFSKDEHSQSSRRAQQRSQGVGWEHKLIQVQSDGRQRAGNHKGSRTDAGDAGDTMLVQWSLITFCSLRRSPGCTHTSAHEERNFPFPFRSKYPLESQHARHCNIIRKLFSFQFWCISFY